MTREKKTKGFFSSSEMGLVDWFRRKKGEVLEPVLKLFVKMKITPNILSLVGVLLIVGGLVASVMSNDLQWFLVGLWLQVIIFDNLDGSLARYIGKASEGGFWVDFWSDFMGIMAGGFYVHLAMGSKQGPYVSAFLLLYFLLLFGAVIMGKRGISIIFFLRPRLFLFGALTVDYFFQTEILITVFWLAFAALIISLLEFIYRIFSFSRKKS